MYLYLVAPAARKRLTRRSILIGSAVLANGKALLKLDVHSQMYFFSLSTISVCITPLHLSFVCGSKSKPVQERISEKSLAHNFRLSAVALSPKLKI